MIPYSAVAYSPNDITIGASRRDEMRIAQRFNAGIAPGQPLSPKGTIERVVFHPSLRDSPRAKPLPSVSTLGYCQLFPSGPGVTNIISIPLVPRGIDPSSVLCDTDEPLTLQESTHA